MELVVILFACIPFYALGAFPTGLLIARMYGVDITASGSGNVGATNVARVIGKKAGVLTLIGDICKGLFGVLLAKILFASADLQIMSGVSLVFGHCFSFPPYLKGGKGVATAIGVLIALQPSIALCTMAVFALVFYTRRIVSLASVLAAMATPLLGLVINASNGLLIGLTAISSVVVFRHAQNITRLIEGREPQFSFKKSQQDKEA
jgi:glycerol-3-phosphate acyltransferase PlsY